MKRYDLTTQPQILAAARDSKLKSSNEADQSCSSRKKYLVTITRTGCLFIEADSESKAMDIADHQTTNTVNWSDDWEPTDCVELDSEDYKDFDFISERAFD